MKKIFFYSSLSAFVFLIASCGSKMIFKSEWRSTPVSVDGKPDEWKLPLRYLDAKSTLNYTIANDNQNLFICIKASDSDALTKILRAGMQVWIDTMGQKKQHVGIEYPLSAIERGGDEEKVSSSVKDKAEIDMYKKRIVGRCTEMFLTGFKPPLGARTLKKEPTGSGLSVTIDWDATGSLIYEATIPFKTFYKETLTPADSLKNFGLCVIVNALPKPKNKMVPNATPPGMNGRMGAMGGMPSAIPATKDPIYEKNIFWIKFQPAVKP